MDRSVKSPRQGLGQGSHEEASSKKSCPQECVSCRALRGGSRRRGGWELEEKPAWAALCSGSVKGAWKICRKPEAALGILGFIFCRQAGASPALQQGQGEGALPGSAAASGSQSPGPALKCALLC